MLYQCFFDKILVCTLVTQYPISFQSCIFNANIIANAYSQRSLDMIELKLDEATRKMLTSLKSSFLKNQNKFDAIKYQKKELYCREKQLEWIDAKIFSKDWLDKWQLWFYRLTSDHHTDLLKTGNSIMCLVFIFGLMSFLTMLGFAYYFDKGFSIQNSFDALHLRIFYDSHIKLLLYEHPYRVLGINFGFLVIFLVLFLLSISKHIRRVFVPLGHIMALAMFSISPKLLLPAIGFFTDKRSILDPLSMIGGIYTLLFGLLTYSLIKTARKNSIVPN